MWACKVVAIRRSACAMGKPGPPLANAIFVFILMGGVKQRRFFDEWIALNQEAKLYILPSFIWHGPFRYSYKTFNLKNKFKCTINISYCPCSLMSHLSHPHAWPNIILWVRFSCCLIQQYLDVMFATCVKKWEPNWIVLRYHDRAPHEHNSTTGPTWYACAAQPGWCSPTSPTHSPHSWHAGGLCLTGQIKQKLLLWSGEGSCQPVCPPSQPYQMCSVHLCLQERERQSWDSIG